VGGSSTYVAALLMDAGDRLYVAGQFTTAGGAPANYIALWDGTTWSPLGLGLNYYVNGLLFDAAHNLYASGWFTTAGGVPANYIAKWDGATWSPMGSGLNYVTFSLASDQAGRMYAGGAFTSAGTNVSAYVAQANILQMLSKSHRNSDGTISFNILSTPNSTNRILVATNLNSPVVWQPIFTNVAPPNGAWQFTDTNASHYPKRFYRSSSP
jgi:hypothetical protein